MASDTGSKPVYFPTRMYAAGYRDLISVVPPNAQLAPTSKIEGQMRGKVPGRRTTNGLWVGYDWRKAQHTAEEVKQWELGGANVGMRADHFPAVDIDVLDEQLAADIEAQAIKALGAAPMRVGRWPKRLLMFRTSEPFSRMRLWIKVGDGKEAIHHLVEVLGQGQQYLVHGTHPNTGKAFEWKTPVPEAHSLTSISREQASQFLDELGELMSLYGFEVEREGDGRPVSRDANAVAQEEHRAPSLDALRAAVEALPNTNELFPARHDYLKVGYAIKAAAGPEHEVEAQALFAEWAARWEGNGRSAGNDPDVVLADWRRLRPPFSVGWSYLSEMARPHGFNSAALVFQVEVFDDSVTGPPTPPNAQPKRDRAPFLSDQWLASEIISTRGSEIRYVDRWGQFLVWRDGRWMPDAVRAAEDIIKTELKKIANFVQGMGISPQEIKEYERKAERIASSGTASAVRTLMQSDPLIALSPDSLDQNRWLLNTPSGVIDLKTGHVIPPDPNQMQTKSTSVPVDFHSGAPEWMRFLDEATGHDRELQSYLQRLAGYCLTGATDEQHLTFIHGPPGTGKSRFLSVLFAIMGDYARRASMAAFTESKFERHETELAMLHGARLVTASETKAGGRWDEQRITELTGGEPVSARFMRENHFTFTPQFKLLFTGNHKPELRGVQGGIRRRLHLVPFVTSPKVIDKTLPEKHAAEYPAILAWMVEGCLLWQAEGLRPPKIVQDTTDDYLHDEDTVGRWKAERTVEVEGGTALSVELYADWREWCGENGEYAGSLRRFVSAMQSHKLEKWQDPSTRRNGFRGIILRSRDSIDNIL